MFVFIRMWFRFIGEFESLKKLTPLYNWYIIAMLIFIVFTWFRKYNYAWKLETRMALIHEKIVKKSLIHKIFPGLQSIINGGSGFWIRRRLRIFNMTILPQSRELNFYINKTSHFFRKKKYFMMSMLLLYKGVKTRVGWNIEPTVCQQNLNMLKLEFIHFCTLNQFEQLQFEMNSSLLTLLGGFLTYALWFLLWHLWHRSRYRYGLLSRHFIFTIFGFKL